MCVPIIFVLVFYAHDITFVDYQQDVHFANWHLVSLAGILVRHSKFALILFQFFVLTENFFSTTTKIEVLLIFLTLDS